MLSWIVSQKNDIINKDLTIRQKVGKYKFIPSIWDSRKAPVAAIKYGRRMTPNTDMSITSEGTHQSHI